MPDNHKDKMYALIETNPCANKGEEFYRIVVIFDNPESAHNICKALFREDILFSNYAVVRVSDLPERLISQHGWNRIETEKLLDIMIKTPKDKSIYQKTYYRVTCSECGEDLSGVPDCGFTVYDTIENAKQAIVEAEWILDGDHVICDYCQREKVK